MKLIPRTRKGRIIAGVAVAGALALAFAPTGDDPEPDYVVYCEDANSPWTFEVYGEDVYQDGTLTELTPEAAEEIVWCSR